LYPEGKVSTACETSTGLLQIMSFWRLNRPEPGGDTGFPGLFDSPAVTIARIYFPGVATGSQITCRVDVEGVVPTDDGGSELR